MNRHVDTDDTRVGTAPWVQRTSGRLTATELLFAGALLHDTGLVNPTGTADFTLTSARLARQVAEQVGAPTDATDTLMTAITMHYTPGCHRRRRPSGLPARRRRRSRREHADEGESQEESAHAEPR